jgi:Cu/Ag efflux pump CusA
MLSRIIDLCARNRFLVFTGVLLLTLAGIWSLRHVPLDALPDISDVQVIVHTSWAGQPPDIIEDQVTYPIVTSLLAAPHVKAVRAQTMFGDSYVYVVFEDGTDLYWARSRVVEYLQQIGGRLPSEVHPAIGPDATGAGWVFEYAIVDKSGKHDLADLRTLQDWHLRYALETVPGVSEVATADMIRNLRVGDSEGHFIPLVQLADIQDEEGPAQISREGGQRRISVEVNARGRDLAGFVAEAQKAVAAKVKVPSGYELVWGGQFEQLQSASKRLMIVVPVALALIFALLYFNF